jgi:hypothetical protein
MATLSQRWDRPGYDARPPEPVMEYRGYRSNPTTLLEFLERRANTTHKDFDNPKHQTMQEDIVASPRRFGVDKDIRVYQEVRLPLEDRDKRTLTVVDALGVQNGRIVLWECFTGDYERRGFQFEKRRQLLKAREYFFYNYGADSSPYVVLPDEDRWSERNRHYVVLPLNKLPPLDEQYRGVFLRREYHERRRR